MQASKTDSPFHVELATSVGKVFREVISKDSSGLATNGKEAQPALARLVLLLN